MTRKTFLNNGSQLVIAVDFDGTITTEPEMGGRLELQPNCAEVLRKWKRDGHKLILWTCRTGESFDHATKFLKSKDLFMLFDAANSQLPDIEARFFPDVARKVGADVYLDDKGLGTIVDWLRFDKGLQEIVDELKEPEGGNYIG
jgi:hydroxymethylpyrimidine pyrophosphatase-like HAD family hydrolase